jgi:hypothetical protein
MFAPKDITRTTWNKLVILAKEGATHVPTLPTALFATMMWPFGTSSNATLIVPH